MIDIRSYLTEIGIPFHKANERNITTTCPFCGDDSGRFTISVDPHKPVWNCWRGRCEMKGDWVKLVMTLEQLPFHDAYNKVHDTIDLDFLPSKPKSKEKKSEIVLPPSFSWTLNARNYLRGRGVSDEQATAVGAYYCNSYPYENRIVFPITIDTYPVSFQARAISPKMPLRYRAPADSDMAECLYNYDGIAREEVYLVEGIFDALRLMREGLNVVATFGKKISDQQIQLLKRKGISSVCLLYDADALKMYETLAVRLNPYFNLSYCLLFGGDPAECKDLSQIIDSKCESLDAFYTLRLKRKLAS